ncbi:MAG: pyrimidine-nucleoside phosphorylase [Chloroflexi bacterium]|nr:pyrimidine-nucleoside phosphorylase [Chloroflexota bacterium]MDK1045627.1 pyrimidine-nucleoside phosphorylase [Anaerolineales bacterium]MCH8876564.1 pyrimidine-nucleoside phosphorylase [Chloroflexota bacterium]MCI0772391.1 pyrimidine-nucleoside phosphorylase [Chloroflexota bacterium]MCI0806559.1 pyrimidine-nucleoside phosphorylase [Chloroflexota bacterium]
MRAVDVIIKKRDGGELTSEEIEFFIAGFARNEIPDYQAAAWAMAILLKGMTPRESTDLTLAMVASGDQLDLSNVVPLAVDKHSTGGVGDKTTLVVEPMVAACGVPVGKMSGRGLGFSGGTLDKMESIPGFKVDLSTKQFLRQLRDVGLVLTGQTADLAPADGKLYALRDVSGTVPSIPLIASSVMSKKIATGAQAIVLDVKVGVGAFMKNLEQAEELAELMVEIGGRAGRRVVALISDMNQPLGNAVGNALEVREAIETLRGEGPPDFNEHCLVVAGQMLRLAGKASDLPAASDRAAAALADGSAFAKFRELVAAQGGDTKYIDEPERLPAARLVKTITAPKSGFVVGIHAAEIGSTAVGLGGGRAMKGDKIDHAVGLIVHHKVGDKIAQGDELFTIHANDEKKLAQAEARALEAHTIGPEPVDPLPLFYKTIGNDG